MAQPDVHRSKLPLRSSFSRASPGRQPTRGGVGVVGGGFYMQRLLFGCSGAGRSCPFSTRCSAAPPSKPVGSSLRSMFPDFRTLLQNDGERPPRKPTRTPLPLRSTRFDDIKLSCPHNTATKKPGCCKRSWLNPSFLTGRLACFHLGQEKESGGKRPGIREQ